VKLSIVAILLACSSLQAVGGLSVVSAVTYQAGPVAPESFASAFGNNLGSEVSVTDSGRRQSSAPVFYTSPGQINFLIPAGTALGPATVLVEGRNGDAQTTVEVGAVSPGLFQTGMLVVLSATDGSQTIVPTGFPEQINLGTQSLS